MPVEEFAYRRDVVGDRPCAACPAGRSCRRRGRGVAVLGFVHEGHGLARRRNLPHTSWTTAAQPCAVSFAAICSMYGGRAGSALRASAYRRDGCLHGSREGAGQRVLRVRNDGGVLRRMQAAASPNRPRAATPVRPRLVTRTSRDSGSRLGFERAPIPRVPGMDFRPTGTPCHRGPRSRTATVNAAVSATLTRPGRLSGQR